MYRGKSSLFPGSPSLLGPRFHTSLPGCLQRKPGSFLGHLIPSLAQSTSSVHPKLPFDFHGESFFHFHEEYFAQYILPSSQMMPSTWTPVINDTSFSVIYRRTHCLALHRSRPISSNSPSTSNMCHFLLAFFSPYWHFESSGNFLGKFTEACTNVCKTFRWVQSQPFFVVSYGG